MSESSVRVVVARHKEELDWLVAVPEDYEIYVSNSSGEEQVGIPDMVADRVVVKSVENSGREAGHWLRYIVDCYDSLADYNIFVQGAPHVGHTGDILFQMERKDLAHKSFKYLCAKVEPTRYLGAGSGFTPRALIATAVGRKYPIQHHASGGVWGGQHYATREVIHNYPKEWYELILSKSAKPMFANTFEHAWNVVYGVAPEIMPKHLMPESEPELLQEP